MGLDKWIMTRIHRYRLTQKSFTILKSSLLDLSPPLRLNSWQPLILLSVVLPSPGCYIVGFDSFSNSFSKNPPISKSFYKAFGLSHLKHEILLMLPHTSLPALLGLNVFISNPLLLGRGIM